MSIYGNKKKQVSGFDSFSNFNQLSTQREHKVQTNGVDGKYFQSKQKEKNDVN